MHNSGKTIGLLVVISTSLLVYCSNNKVIIGVDSKLREFSVKRGKQISINLKANFSSGCSWIQIDSCSVLMTRKGMSFKTQADGNDSQLFEYEIKRKGNCNLKFYYHRPFDKGLKPKDSALIKIDIL
jgi:predicted secreted protein